jgi:lipopolysaccharide export system ATP-binding protein
MESMLSMQAVAKSFQGRPILRNLSLLLNAGEIVALLGPNGAGKTTTFRLMAGLDKPDCGTIALNGRDITRMPFYSRARCGISYLPQESAIFSNLTLEENFQIVQEARRESATTQRATTDKLLGEFSLSDLRGTLAAKLSGGERRRAAFALIVACEPKFILLDEPFAALDPISVSEMKASIKNLARRGIGVLITDHNARELLPVADRAYVIFAGRLLADGNADAIMANSEVRQIYLGDGFRV